MPRLQQFDFKTILEEPRLGVGAVINLKPRASEEGCYFNTPAPNTVDFAVVGLIPGMVPGHRALICAGTMTYGTEAAVEFLLREDGIRALYAAQNHSLLWTVTNSGSTADLDLDQRLETRQGCVLPGSL